MAKLSIDLLKSIVIFLDWCDRDVVINNIGISGVLLNEKEKRAIDVCWKKHTKLTRFISDMVTIYYVNGKIHRSDGPAIIWHEKHESEWWQNNIRIRVENK